MTDNRLTVFNELKNLLKAYEPPFTAISDFQGRYELTSKKEVVIAGRTKSDVYFAAAIIQSRYVGFYFMPIYDEASVASRIPSELMKTLKGKACFHIKSLDEPLKKQIAIALRIGFAYYKRQGWV